MPKQATNLRELATVRADNRATLNAIVGTQGTALGRKNFSPDVNPDGEPCIIVYVSHKLHDSFLTASQRVPPILSSADKSLEARTDVVVTTASLDPKGKPRLTPENQALVDRLQWKDGLQDHLVPGVQIGGYNLVDGTLTSELGTLGYCVGSTTHPAVGFLTNQHVAGTVGRSLYVPGGRHVTARIGVCRTIHEHYPDEEWLKGVNEPFAYVRSDAAFVAVDEPFVKLLTNDIPKAGP